MPRTAKHYYIAVSKIVWENCIVRKCKTVAHIRTFSDYILN